MRRSKARSRAGAEGFGAAWIIIVFLFVSCDRNARQPDRSSTSGPADTSAAQAEDTGDEGPDGAVAVVHSYYDAIAAHAFERAYRYWGDSGPPGQSLEDFARGFASTSTVRVITGSPSRIDPAAGSRYIEVPVEIIAKTTSGEEQHFIGKYILRRTVVDGASPAQRRWHFTRAEIREATSEPDSVP